MDSGKGIRRALLRSEDSAGWWLFERPEASVVATELDEVRDILAAAERHAASGHWAVGYVAYEAAPAFDAALPVRADSRSPLAAFGLFGAPRELSDEELAAVWGGERGEPDGITEPAPAWNEAEHAAALAEVRGAIARGETYQVNLTFPLRGRLVGSPEALFARLARAAAVPYAAFLDCGSRAILSLSPELFFERQGEWLRMRPMKGTRPRGRFPEEDGRLAAELVGSAKDRAENLMIVDMARNDLGRIARPGTVATRSLFDLERYPTVWQMTSTVEAVSPAGLAEIFAALFPCASVTGAPKRSTMGWISRLEPEPRGVYCGAVGYVAPGERTRFAVAIRTAELERASGALRYGVGSGVVWDSDPAEEYRECLAKGRALVAVAEPFALFETMRWTLESGIARLDRHLARLAASAAYFGFRWDEDEARRSLVAALEPATSEDRRVRLRFAADGALAVEVEAAPPTSPWTAIVASEPVDASDPLLFHKTTRRGIYERALEEARARGADEAILRNASGELTEGTRANLALEIGGERLTPRLACGLVPGVLRAELLERGELREAVLTVDDLARAERLWFLNALRGWIPATWAGAGKGAGPVARMRNDG